MKKLHIVIVIGFAVFLTACGSVSVPISPIEAIDEVATGYETLVITAVGDVMVHEPQLRAQYRQEKQAYDFTNNFHYMKPYIKRAHIAIANLETTFAGEDRSYSGFPRFNAPDALADALKEAGFHLVSTANNHTYDQGVDGVVRTLQVLEERGIKAIGTRKNPEEKGYVILEEKGIKVGISAYTYETPRWNGYKTINGIKLHEDAVPLIDSFSYEAWEEDAAKISARISEMKAAGAELIVFSMHWGEEYQQSPTPHQKKIAQELCTMGVDVIFGSHPHVLQPIEVIQSEDKSQETVVVYSMGNFISNQRKESLGNRNTEDGLLVEVIVKKNIATQNIKIVGVAYVPTWVHRYHQNGKNVYEIIPVVQAAANPEDFALFSPESQRRVQVSMESSLNLLKSNHPMVYARGLKPTVTILPAIE